MKKTMKIGFFRELKTSRGRFISIMLLMFLSTFTLVGLKLVGPDIRMMANEYLNEYRLADLTVISNYGLSEDDTELLDAELTDANVEYGYFTDVTVGDTNQGVRLYSTPDSISEVELVSGSMPTTSGQIAISNQMSEEYPIGSTITVTEKGKKINNVLAVHEYEVVGYVNSLEILSTMDLGATNVGTGVLNGYGVVSPDDFDSEVYMIARIDYDDLRNDDAFLDDYLTEVADRKAEVEAVLKGQPKVRLTTIKDEANSEIADAEQEIADGEQELDDAKQELADAKVTLEDAEAELASGKQELDDGQAEVTDGLTQIETAKTELANAQAEIDTNRTTLEGAQAELDAGQQEIDENRAQLESAQTELNANKEQLDTSLAQLNEGKAGYEAGISEIETNISNINLALSDPTLTEAQIAEYNATLTALNTALTQTQAEYDGFMTNVYNPSIADINSGLAQIETGQTEIDSGNAQLDAAQLEIDNNQATVTNGLAELEAGQLEVTNGLNEVATNEQTLNEAQAEINQGLIEYEEGLAEYQDGLAEYQEGLAEFNEKEPEARQDIEDAKQEIEDAKQEIEDLSLPTYTVNTRSETSTSGGYQLLSSLATSIDKVANVFPILLYAVAALVTFTTMTRFVEDERINTGTLLSLGYTESEIVKKYVIYGALSSSLGAILGIILGAVLIPLLLYTAFRGQFTTPDLILTFNFGVAATALVVSMLCAVIPAFLVSSAEFKFSPASLLLPKPPSDGSKIFLERITPIWERMSFAHKVTARNIFRYKKRMFMTIFGVSGSVALLFTGLAMQGSIESISEIQFGQIIDYDMIAVVDENADEEDIDIIKSYISDDMVEDSKPVYIESISSVAGENNERQAITLTVADDFTNYVNFGHRTDDQQVTLNTGEVIISERLAQIMELEEGDNFEVLSSENLPVELTVGGITEMYMGHFMYATPQTYEQAFGKPANLGSYLVKFKDSSLDNVNYAATEMLKLDGVLTVMQNESLISQVDVMADSLNSVMQLIIVLSGLLAIVILYNITNINVNERMRELSTTKVLGYYDNEVTMYIYRETVILSLIGIITGYGFGRIIHVFMMQTVSPSNMMFDYNVVLSAFTMPALLIIVISFILGIIVHRKLIKVDMLEALKSVE